MRGAGSGALSTAPMLPGLSSRRRDHTSVLEDCWGTDEYKVAVSGLDHDSIRDHKSELGIRRNGMVSLIRQNRRTKMKSGCRGIRGVESQKPNRGPIDGVRMKLHNLQSANKVAVSIAGDSLLHISSERADQLRVRSGHANCSSKQLPMMAGLPGPALSSLDQSRDTGHAVIGWRELRKTRRAQSDT
jgi:hypothetical protein